MKISRGPGSSEEGLRPMRPAGMTDGSQGCMCARACPPQWRKSVEVECVSREAAVEIPAVCPGTSFGAEQGWWTKGRAGALGIRGRPGVVAVRQTWALIRCGHQYWVGFLPKRHDYCEDSPPARTAGASALAWRGRFLRGTPVWAWRGTGLKGKGAFPAGSWLGDELAGRWWLGAAGRPPAFFSAHLRNCP